MSLGFWKAKAEARNQWSDVLKTMKENTFQSRIPYLAKLLMWWKNKAFSALMSSTLFLSPTPFWRELPEDLLHQNESINEEKGDIGSVKETHHRKALPGQSWKRGPGEEDTWARPQWVGSSGIDFLLKIMTQIESLEETNSLSGYLGNCRRSEIKSVITI